MPEVIIFRLWTIRNEAPKYAMISIWGTLNDYIGMGMRGLINFDDYLKESLAHLRGCFELSYKYSTILGICNEFKISMLSQLTIEKNFGNGKRCNDSPRYGSIY
jgi:hypothetical protein